MTSPIPLIYCCGVPVAGKGAIGQMTSPIPLIYCCGAPVPGKGRMWNGCGTQNV